MTGQPKLVVLIRSTASTPGAIAILQLVGHDCERVLRKITGAHEWPIGRMRLANLAGVDEGLAVMLSPRVAQIMPHGGLRVMQRLTAEIRRLGVTIGDETSADPFDLFPEAEDRFEALMLLAMSRAESPLAIDLLLDQPRRWREWAALGRPLPGEDDRARSRRLNRLVDPPIVVLAGPPNVGKSTLSNVLLGRAMSIAADMPGTTRDYTSGRIDLGGLVVDWHDTPGLHDSDDAIEQKAIAISRRLIERADLLIAMRDADHDWPELPRRADLWVVNKCDEGIERPDNAITSARPLRISATRGLGVGSLVSLARERLVSVADLGHAGLWLFDPRLLHE